METRDTVPAMGGGGEGKTMKDRGEYPQGHIRGSTNELWGHEKVQSKARSADGGSTITASLHHLLLTGGTCG